ncbi:signal transduction histidine kinase [Streptomyces sp. B3I7]|uniref:sensor histidine kinase n=1 Tax=Streptomyces sp. B3I7 TaxID=3042269 RepID=UPI00277FF09B|nr:nitrate- and nitrite sensing domain-containing protein [Streptomyces sp. B3I7]MDQ0811234.1 signal transduction histidine kinase [Streptomyces sp. B3I7]
MRAPVQKTRPRRPGKQTPPAQDGASSESVGRGRPTHVRNRLIVAVAVVAAAVAGAGAPSIVAASGDLNDSQGLVTLNAQTRDALSLAHSLADERDQATVFVAAGRPKSKAPGERRSARVDRQIEELRADPDLPEALRTALDDVAAVRRSALTGRSGALDTHRAYTEVLGELHALAEDLADKLPPRAGSGDHALATLDTAVQQAGAARGLLLAALAVPHGTRTVIDPVTGLPTTSSSGTAADAKQRDALTAAAQLADVRSDAAVAGFRDTADTAAKNTYDTTVTGPEVATAEKYLTRLTDQPTFSDSDLNTSSTKLETALSARIDAMRGAESSLYERRGKDLEQLRDDDVTALEIRIAVLGALVLLAVAIATALARSLTHPLGVLRKGSARVAGDPAGEEPVKFTGRNDEFAQVVRSVNALQTHAAALQERVNTLETDRKHLIDKRQSMADERQRLREELDAATGRLEQARGSIHGTFVNLALRTLALVERQLGVIEGLEEREQDPERLGTLFKLDHLATVMRRHSENLLVLAGAEHGQQHAGPVPLVDVVRAAVSEIERYDRVRIAALPPHAHVTGFAADDLSHLLAELLENATSFSPPDAPVEISGWLLENGEVMLSVQDEGIGITADRLTRLNARLTEFDPERPHGTEDGEGLGLGLYVVARLAHRHGVRVRLREQKQGGSTAVTVLPTALLAGAEATAVAAPGAPAAPGTAALGMPGAGAEANSNVLPARSRPAPPGDGDEDPLIAAAEATIRAHEAATEAAAPAAAPSAEAESAPEAAQGDAPARDDVPVQHGRQGEAVTSETTMELLAPSVPAEPAGHESPAPASAVPGPSGPAAGASPADAPTGDPYSIGPDSHERSVDEGAAPASAPGRAPRLTAKGLPKRTPRISAPVEAPPSRSGGVDAEALRRRLGGFHQGARKGARAAEAELAERSGEEDRPEGTDRPEETDRPGGTHRSGKAGPAARTDQGTAPATEDHGTPQDTAAVDTSGGTVEEATS